MLKMLLCAGVTNVVRAFESGFESGLLEAIGTSAFVGEILVGRPVGEAVV
jgi:hypothetical protein